MLTRHGDETEVVFRWNVATRGLRMNALASRLKPQFAWNHDYVMAQGKRALGSYLGGGADRQA